MNKQDLEKSQYYGTNFELQNINGKTYGSTTTIYHNLIKKAFDRVWYDGLWHVMSEFGIGKDLIKIIKSLYISAKSYVLLNNHIVTDFNTTVGVRQGSLLSSV